MKSNSNLIFEVYCGEGHRLKAAFYLDSGNTVSVALSRDGKVGARSRSLPWVEVIPFLMFIKPGTTELELAAIQGTMDEIRVR